jgi:hypothetical protein
MPKAHMPKTKVRVGVMEEEKKHTSKGKGELEERNGSSTTRAEAMGHDVNIRMTATEFGVNDDKTNCPVCDAT